MEWNFNGPSGETDDYQQSAHDSRIIWKLKKVKNVQFIFFFLAQVRDETVKFEKFPNVWTLTWQTWRTLRGRSRSLWPGRPHIPVAWAGFLPRCGIFDRQTIWKRRTMREWDPDLHAQFSMKFVSINSQYAWCLSMSDPNKAEAWS